MATWTKVWTWLALGPVRQQHLYCDRGIPWSGAAMARTRNSTSFTIESPFSLQPMSFTVPRQRYVSISVHVVLIFFMGVVHSFLISLSIPFVEMQIIIVKRINEIRLGRCVTLFFSYVFSKVSTSRDLLHIWARFSDSPTLSCQSGQIESPAMETAQGWVGLSSKVSLPNNQDQYWGCNGV